MRSLLFIPADSPKKLEKGLSSGADALILDLEDSISAERKALARASAAAFLKDVQPTTQRPRLIVRVNGLGTEWIKGDLASFGAHPGVDAVLVPKVGHAGPCVARVSGGRGEWVGCYAARSAALSSPGEALSSTSRRTRVG